MSDNTLCRSSLAPVPPPCRETLFIAFSTLETSHILALELVAEPRSLPFRVLPRLDDDPLLGLRKASQSRLHVTNRSIASRVPRRRILRDGTRQTSDFLGPAAAEHDPGAPLD